VKILPSCRNLPPTVVRGNLRNRVGSGEGEAPEYVGTLDVKRLFRLEWGVGVG